MEMGEEERGPERLLIRLMDEPRKFCLLRLDYLLVFKQLKRGTLSCEKWASRSSSYMRSSAGAIGECRRMLAAAH